MAANEYPMNKRTSSRYKEDKLKFTLIIVNKRKVMFILKPALNTLKKVHKAL